MNIYPYQQECLDALTSARRKGRKKALVVMATGLGKTVVSALQLQQLLIEAPGRVLYITHQKEILRQARSTYEKILDPKTTYGYYHGQEKHLRHADVLFASFQTMALSRDRFAPDEFRYVIVDEAHHVQAETYKPTLEYFQSDFMIGLTATPERGDRQDITDILGEPVFELDLFDALTERHLTAIDYRLMTDELQNLQVLETPAGKLNLAELNRTLFIPRRDEEIVRIIDDRTAHIVRPRMMIFCASIAHAKQLEDLMPHAILVHSKMPLKIKEERIKNFRSSKSATVITVDMFNEGIDIPEANVIVFLRSTASRTIYLQQLGRGLRRTQGKDSVLVLDFVANCDRIEMIGSLQAGVAASLEMRPIVPKQGAGSTEPAHRDVLTLTIDGGQFDERLVNLIDIVRRAARPYTKEELAEYLQRKATQLGRTPSRAEVDRDPEAPTSNAFTYTFGKGWAALLNDLGLTPYWSPYTKEQLIEILLAKAKELDRVPTQMDMKDDPSTPSYATFCYVFKTTWNGVLVAAGLTPTKRAHRYTQEELSVQLKAKAERLGRSPSKREVDEDPAMVAGSTFSKIFEKQSWDEVLLATGLEPRTPNKDVLAQRLRVIADDLGRPPLTTDVPGYQAYYHAFGMGWRAILREIGLR